jgi:acetyl-CoA acetyltransferase family protein
MGHLPLSMAGKVQEICGDPFTAELLDRYPIESQGIGAELIAEEYGIERGDLDALAVRSHRLAANATKEGKFAREIIKIDGHETDQGIRPDTSLEALSELKPVFKPDGRLTAGTSSQISDGAAAVLLASAEKAAELGLVPRARIVDQVSVGCDPVKMLEGPIPATARILERSGMSIDDLDLIEVNEAFASVLAAWQKEHSPEMDRVNARGGAMALGHPLGSTGARLIVSLLHALEDEDGERGLVTMCCGGGIGTATVIERL